MTDLLSVYFGKGFAGVREILFKHLILPPNDPTVVRITKQRRKHMKNRNQHQVNKVLKGRYNGPHPTVVAHKDLKMLAQTCRFWHDMIKKYRWKICPNVMHMEVSHMKIMLTSKNSKKQFDKKCRKNLEAMKMDNLIEWIDSL